MAWVSIGIGTSVVGTGLGLWGSKKANDDKKAAQEAYLKAQNKNYFTQQGQNNDWYNRNNINYMDTAEAQGTITRLQDAMRDQNEVVAGNSAITGSTNAMQNAQKKNTQSIMADYMNRLAGQGTQYRNNIENQYFLRNRGLADFRNSIDTNVYAGQMDNANNKAQNWSNFGSNLGNIGANAAMLGGNYFNQPTDALGALNQYK